MISIVCIWFLRQKLTSILPHNLTSGFSCWIKDNREILASGRGKSFNFAEIKFQKSQVFNAGKHYFYAEKSY